MPARYSSDINRLRAALRGKHGASTTAGAIRQAIAGLTPATLVADNSTRYVAANAAAEALTGYSEAELLAMTVADLTPLPLTDEGRRLWSAFIAKGAQHGEYELRRKNGSPVRVRYWAFASVAPGIHVSLLVPSGTEA